MPHVVIPSVSPDEGIRIDSAKSLDKAFEEANKQEEISSKLIEVICSEEEENKLDLIHTVFINTNKKNLCALKSKKLQDDKSILEISTIDRIEFATILAVSHFDSVLEEVIKYELKVLSKGDNQKVLFDLLLIVSQSELKYTTKIKLLKSLDKARHLFLDECEDLLSDLEILNRLRNKFAHEFDFDITSFAEFKNFSDIKNKIISESFKRKRYELILHQVLFITATRLFFYNFDARIRGNRFDRSEQHLSKPPSSLHHINKP